MIEPLVNVPDPCPESWNKMLPDSCGRFCYSCQKKVHDFTHSTFSEFQKVRAQLGDSLCGNFNADEEGRIYFRPEKQKISFSKIFLCAFLLCFNSWLFAGTNTPLHQHLDRVRNEALAQHGPALDIYVHVTRFRKPLKNSRVEMTINGRAFLGETDQRGRCVIRVPFDTYIEQITFDVEGGGIRIYDAYCKTSELSKRNINLKYQNHRKPKRGKMMGFVGCPSF